MNIISNLIDAVHNRYYENVENANNFFDELNKNFEANLAISEIAEKAIAHFNQLYIRFPLLDIAEKKYDLSQFQGKLEDDAQYLGANCVEVKECKLALPLTLYHLLFIYFALKSGNNEEIYPLLKDSFCIKTAKDLVNQEYIRKKILTHEQTAHQLHGDISALLAEKKLTGPLTWKNVKALVSEICKEFEVINEKENELSEERCDNLWYHFYRFCFYGPNGAKAAKFKEMILRVLALEWSAPHDTAIIYRSSRVADDDIFIGQNQSHSLSFSSSLLGGLVFEGTSSGTCPYSYYIHFADKQLYALQLSPAKEKKYFFLPPIFKSHPLLSLVARGEFSHLRLKIFSPAGKISGFHGHFEDGKKLTTFEPTEKLSNPAMYREKIVKIFQNGIRLLGGESSLTL